ELPGGGIVAAAISVGAEDTRLIQYYPLSYAMQPDETRQMVVRHRSEEGIVDLASAAAGTKYYVSDPTVATISEDGLLTAHRAGAFTVTIVNGGQGVLAGFVVHEPAGSGAIIGSEGGMIEADGITVGIPIGALSGDTSITVHSRSQSDMPFALPTGWDFDAALQVDFGGTQLEQGLSVALPAPAGAIPGEIRYIMQPGVVHLADGTTEQTWVIMDTLV